MHMRMHRCMRIERASFFLLALAASSPLVRPSCTTWPASDAAEQCSTALFMDSEGEPPRPPAQQSRDSHLHKHVNMMLATACAHTPGLAWLLHACAKLTFRVERPPTLPAGNEGAADRLLAGAQHLRQSRHSSRGCSATRSTTCSSSCRCTGARSHARPERVLARSPPPLLRRPRPICRLWPPFWAASWSPFCRADAALSARLPQLLLAESS